MENNSSPFTIHDQYVKDLSFENPNVLLKYTESNSKPDVSVNVETHVLQLKNETYEVELKTVVTSKVENKQLFLIELKYCGLVSVDTKLNQEQLEPILLVHVPFLIFPFVREILADITKNGGYPPLLIAPIDFAALYLKKKEEVQKANSTNTERGTVTNTKK